MEKANVLVIGNSGVGKSTLINAVLGEDRAETSFGTEGTTKELKIYEAKDKNVPFQLIDTIGFEPSFFKERRAVDAVKKWSKQSAKEGNDNAQINVIWFCIDGVAAKLFPKTIENLSHATVMWPSVPIIAVITKSFSIPDRAKNIEMVNHAFAIQKHRKNLRKIIPVVASTYVLNENAYAPPDGIEQLIDATCELLPEGTEAAKIDIARFKLDRKRALAQGLVGSVTTSAVVVGAIPIPFSDAVLLGTVEMAEIKGLAHIYGISNNEESKKFLSTIVEVGTVSVAAKQTIAMLKSIPGINFGAAVINAVIAGLIVAGLGEGAIYAFEQVYLGKKTVEDIDWLKKIIESKMMSQLMEKATEIVKNVSDKTDKAAIAKIIIDVFSSKQEENLNV